MNKRMVELISRKATVLTITTKRAVFLNANIEKQETSDKLSTKE